MVLLEKYSISGMALSGGGGGGGSANAETLGPTSRRLRKRAGHGGSRGQDGSHSRDSSFVHCSSGSNSKPSQNGLA